MGQRNNLRDFMAYEVVMLYYLHMPSCFLRAFTEYPYNRNYD